MCRKEGSKEGWGSLEISVDSGIRFSGVIDFKVWKFKVL
jgi:hypothetical protein